MSESSPVDHVLNLLQGAQSEYFGEAVTQLEHALQCAQLARAGGADEELVIAALLHDIGHLIAEGDEAESGSPDHDQIGSAYLEQLGFSARVVGLIAGHVQAKRYLTAAHPDYYARLSASSRETLKAQGGPMSPAEAESFPSDPLFGDKLKLRSWDEQAKEFNVAVQPLDSYRALLDRHLKR